MGPFGHDGVGLILADAGDEDEARNDVLGDHALGAVGIDVHLLFAGDVAGAMLLLEAPGDVFATGVGVLLMVEYGDVPFAGSFGVERGVAEVGARYGRATRFVQRFWHNRCLAGLNGAFLCHCLSAVRDSRNPFVSRHFCPEGLGFSDA